MNSTTIGTAGTFGNLKKRHVLAAGMASLAAAVAIGAGVWLSDGSGGSTEVSPAAAFQQAGPVAEPALVLYVVRTVEEADVIRLGELEATGMRGTQSGEAGYRVEILLDGEGVDAAIADAVAIRQQSGLPEAKIIDLR